MGVDIVCVNERDDHHRIDTDGWEEFLDTFDAVFSVSELWDMKFNVDHVILSSGRILSGADIGRADRCMSRHDTLPVILPSGEDVTFGSDVILDAKLRRFYAYFAYKEAFVKLSGEALLADWLKECEFHNVTSPRSAETGVWGEKIEAAEVSLRGETVRDVRLAIQAFEGNHMIATAIKGLDTLAPMPEYTLLDLENDLLAYVSKP